jgi:hypothetical protein
LDPDFGVINYSTDYHTPTGLVDQNYILQSKKEVAEINSKGSATAEATRHGLLLYKDTPHNVQPKTEVIYKQCFGTLVQGNTNDLIFKKLLPTGNRDYYN